MVPGKVLQMIPESAQGELKAGDIISMIPVDVLPFGMEYREQIQASNLTAAAATGTSATISITWGPDTDTDPPDSDI